MPSEVTRTRIDRNAIVAAARQLLDEEGLAGLSMVRLGERLGVTAMALYRHVADRADLEAAVVASVLEDLIEEHEPEGDWVEGVAAWMRGVRDHWLRHPWLGNLLGTQTQLSPAWLATVERLLRLLERGGLPPETVAKELARISRTTAGTVVLEIAAPMPTAGASFPDPIAKHLKRYSNADLFDDLVVETVARLRAAKRQGNVRIR